MKSVDNIIILRRLIIRLALVVIWIGLGIFLFMNNRGHTILVDNRSAEDGSFKAVDLMIVKIDGGKGVEFFKNDRDRFPVVGGKHTIRIEFTNGQAAIEKQFSLSLKQDMFLLSVPKMLAGIEPFIEAFSVVVENKAANEDAEVDDFAFLKGI